MLNTAFAVQTRQPHQYLLGRSKEMKLQVQTMAAFCFESFEKVAEGETTVQAFSDTSKAEIDPTARQVGYGSAQSEERH